MISAILLAAGQSTRMNGENKLIKEIDDIPIIKHALNNILGSSVNEIIIVLGHEKEIIKNIIQKNKKINGKKCYRIGINDGERWKEPVKDYHDMDMTDCFQYYNPTILEYIVSRI